MPTPAESPVTTGVGGGVGSEVDCFTGFRIIKKHIKYIQPWNRV